MASTAVAKRSKTTTTPRRPPAKPKKAEPFELVSEIDSEGYFRAKVFGVEFEFDSEVNGMLIIFAGSGKGEDIVRLIESVIRVVPNDGETFDAAKRRTRNLFLDTVGAQRGFEIEDAAELINSMTEAAGKDNAE